MGTPIGSHRVERHDPALWVELRLGDELAELRRLREAGEATGRTMIRIDDLLERRHQVRPCGWCLGERLDAVVTAPVRDAARAMRRVAGGPA